MKHHALIAGSFDPVTIGHADFIRRTARFFDTVTVCVFCNHEKTNFLLTTAQRVALLETLCVSLPNVSADSSDGYVADYVAAHRICAIVKGVRNDADFAYERIQADYNRRRNPAAETLLLPTDPALAEISASEVRRRIACGEAFDALIPEEARSLLHSFLKQ